MKRITKNLFFMLALVLPLFLQANSLNTPLLKNSRPIFSENILFPYYANNDFLERFIEYNKKIATPFYYFVNDIQIAKNGEDTLKIVMNADSLFASFLSSTNKEYSLLYNLITLHSQMIVYKQNIKVNPPTVVISDEEYQRTALGYNTSCTKTFPQIDSLFQQWIVEKTEDDRFAANYFDIDDSALVNIPDSVFIERIKQIPTVLELAYNEDVRRFIENYTKPRSRNYMGYLVGKSLYYEPFFEEVLDAYNIPLEIKYLPIIESALNPNAVSRAGATGIWQFMFGTGKMYGLEITRYVDQRRDPILATYAAADYFTDMYARYGDWLMSLAAYNCGAGNVNRAIERSGGKTTYWEIQPFLPSETQDYVPRFIAAVYLMNYYAEHGITSKSPIMPELTDTVVITNQKLHFSQVAGVLGISEQEIKDLNPQYIKDYIPAVDNATYSLALPLEYTNQFLTLEDSIYAYQTEASQKLANRNDYRVVDASVGTSGVTGLGTVIPGDNEYVYYKIAQGENLWTIAQKFPGVTNDDIMRLNNLTASSARRLMPGQVLKIKKK